MKGDFTRFTFRPEKRYVSVLMQQGRMQLDADWNEQMSILGYLNQTQAKDMIGGSGTSKSMGGFRISTTPDDRDLVISAGNYYINGQLCELPPGSPIIAQLKRNLAATSPSSSTQDKQILKLQVPYMTVDGQTFARGQWIEITAIPTRSENLLQALLEGTFDSAEMGSPKNAWFRIGAPDNDKAALIDQTLELWHPTFNFKLLQSRLTEDVVYLKLRRLTTYNTQPDYPHPQTLDFPKGLPADQLYLVYLDAWQRHITTLEDPDLKEVALGNADTTTRLKTVWQVKLLLVGDRTAKVDPNQSFDAFNQRSQDRPVYLTARLRPNNRTNGTGGTTLDNNLYRIEVHTGGLLPEARFKWSRENGTVVSPINRIQPQTNLIEVQASDGIFKVGQWVELLTEARELQNRPGILMRLADLRPGGKLIYDPATVTETIDDKLQAELNTPTNRPKLRGWDWLENMAGLPLKSSDPEGWIDLERNIQVRFATDPDVKFQTGDYWLIPTRFTGSLDWVKDAQGQPLPQRPTGIQHTYTRLALVNTQAAQTFEELAEGGDCRTLFPSLVNCVDSEQAFFSGNVGVGVRSAQARLHVRGTSFYQGRGQLTGQANSTKLRGTGTAFQQQLQFGDAIEIVDQDNRPVELFVQSIDSDTQLTVTTALKQDRVNVPFRYRPVQAIPIIRLDTEDEKPRFVLSTEGKVGIGQVQPQTSLDVVGAIQITTSTEANPGFLKIEPRDNTSIAFTSNAGYEFDQTVTIASGNFTVSQGSATINNDLMVNNDLTVNSLGTAILTANTSGVTIAKGLTVSNGGATIVDTLQVNSGNKTILDVDSSGVTLNRSLTIAEGDAIVNGLFKANNGINITDGGLQASGGINVTSGGLTVSGGVNVTSGGLTVAGNVQLASPNQTKQITIQDIGTTVTGGLTVSTGMVTLGSINRVNSDLQLIVTDGITIKNQGITVENGGITVENGGITLTNGTFKVGDLEINSQGLQFKKLVAFPEGVQIDKGLTLRSGTLNLDDSQVINLPNRTLLIRHETSDLVTLKPFPGKPTAKLTLAGGAAIGAQYVTNPDLSGLALDNGLLVEGNFGVGILDQNPLDAKVEIRGTGSRDDSKKLEAAFNVTDSKQRSLFYIRNDGLVSLFSDDRQAPLDNLPEDARSKDPKLYINGNAFVNGNAFAIGNVFVNGNISAKKVDANEFVQLSSRRFKDNIADLSAQDAAEMLKALNPVTFNYTLTDDRTPHAGFIAEDVPDLLSSDDHQSIRILDVVAVLTKTVKDQRDAITTLSRVVKQQQAAIAALTQKIQ
jgi:hypothetical protein